MTQENAALVEEAAAKSLSFQEEAGRLIQVVARFRIAEAAPTARKSPVAGARPVPLKRRLASGGAHAANGDWKEF